MTFENWLSFLCYGGEIDDRELHWSNPFDLIAAGTRLRT